MHEVATERIGDKSYTREDIDNIIREIIMMFPDEIYNAEREITVDLETGEHRYSETRAVLNKSDAIIACGGYATGGWSIYFRRDNMNIDPVELVQIRHSINNFYNMDRAIFIDEVRLNDNMLRRIISEDALIETVGRISSKLLSILGAKILPSKSEYENHTAYYMNSRTAYRKRLNEATRHAKDYINSVNVLKETMITGKEKSNFNISINHANRSVISLDALITHIEDGLKEMDFEIERLNSRGESYIITPDNVALTGLLNINFGRYDASLSLCIFIGTKDYIKNRLYFGYSHSYPSFGPAAITVGSAFLQNHGFDIYSSSGLAYYFRGRNADHVLNFMKSVLNEHTIRITDDMIMCFESAAKSTMIRQRQSLEHEKERYIRLVANASKQLYEFEEENTLRFVE